MDGPLFPSAKQCGNYGASHTVHHIQAIRCAEDNVSPRWLGRVLTIRGEVIVVAFDDGEVARYRHHDTARLQARLTAFGRTVVIIERWALLHTHGLHSVARDTGKPLSPCPGRAAGENPDAQLKRLHAHGGA